jgi:hypothetical protein
MSIVLWIVAWFISAVIALGIALDLLESWRNRNRPQPETKPIYSED